MNLSVFDSSYSKGVVVKRSKHYCGFKNHINKIEVRKEGATAALHLPSGYNPDDIMLIMHVYVRRGTAGVYVVMISTVISQISRPIIAF